MLVVVCGVYKPLCRRYLVWSTEQMGPTNTLDSDYDGYAECVKTNFDPDVVFVTQLMAYFLKLLILVVSIIKGRISA